MDSRIQLVDITPDRSIFHKIGEANYSVSDAIAELVDNSIDATCEEGVEVIVVLDKKNGKIIIEDNGRGMDREFAAKALVLASSQKKNSLGEFGLGLKSACTSLGRRFQLRTSQKGSPEEYELIYDRDEFMKSGDWTRFPIATAKVQKNSHGTIVEISDLRVKLYDPLVTRLKEDLSQRYGPFIRHNNVVIRVGMNRDSAKPCHPQPITLDDGGKNEFSHTLSSGDPVHGWWGLRKIASGSQSGFDMFRRGRLIRASEKLGYNAHPMTAHITGEIHLDGIPVTHNKREFITESGEFREFIETFWGDKTGLLTGQRIKGLIDEITSKASERWNREKVDKQLPDTLKDELKNNILRALNRVTDFKEMAFPDLPTQKKRSEDGEDAPAEERGKGLRVASEEAVEPERENQKRTPGKTKSQTAKFVMINGRKFRFDFFWKNLGEETKDKETVLTESGVEIYINTGFKGFNLSKDSNYYSVHHVAEALAEIYLRETEQPLGRIFELRNKLLYEVASVVMEEDELRKLTKQEEELEKIKSAKREMLLKAQESSL